MFAKLQGVKTIATSKATSFRSKQPICWPLGDSGSIAIAVVDSAGAALDLTGSTLLLSVRQAPTVVGTPPISRQVSPDAGTGGTATFSIVAGDTLQAGLGVGAWCFDVEVIDGAGNRWQVVPVSEFRIAPALSAPGQDVTVPPAQAPYANPFVWRGAYSGATAYAVNNVVSYAPSGAGGAVSSYVCVASTTGNLPTNSSFWNLMAGTGI